MITNELDTSDWTPKDPRKHKNPFGYTLIAVIVCSMIIGYIYQKEDMHPLGQAFLILLLIAIGCTLFFKTRK